MVQSFSVGLDFGTSNSSCCVIDSAGEFRRTDMPLVPSIALFTPDHQFGCQADLTIGDTIVSGSKELRALFDVLFWEFKRQLRKKTERNRGIKQINGRWITAVDVVSEFFGYMLKGAGLLKDDVAIASLCLTHPVNFTQEQKDILREALYRNGFCREIKLLPEPVAAALGYERKFPELKQKKGILVFDFGGGTLDVAYVMRNENGELVSPRANASGMTLLAGENIGGSELDMLVYRVAAPHLGLQESSWKVDLEVKRDCKKLKEALSNREEFGFQIRREGKTQAFKMKRHEFEMLLKEDMRILPVLKRCLKTVVDAVAADPSLPKIDCLLPIGGSCRVPAIGELLRNATPSGAQIMGLMPDDVAVAMGAAIEAAHCSPVEQIESFRKAFLDWVRGVARATGCHCCSERRL